MANKRALVSVSNKKDIIPFTKGLKKKGFDIITTGGTARDLIAAGIEVIKCEDYTGIQQSPLLKTMDDRIYGPMFYPGTDEADIQKRRELVTDMIRFYSSRPDPESEITNIALEINDPDSEPIKVDAEIVEYFSMTPITLIVNNFYPFEETVKKGGDLQTAVKNFDVGGPTMLRTAFKMGLLDKNIGILTNPHRYSAVLAEMDSEGNLPLDVIHGIGLESFGNLVAYDKAAHSHFENYALSTPGWARLPEIRKVAPMD
jgi:phosphoribosylaminoimidazolecarboxamide formyltransferase / IMP cyclohydrolase